VVRGQGRLFTIINVPSKNLIRTRSIASCHGTAIGPNYSPNTIASFGSAIGPNYNPNANSNSSLGTANNPNYYPNPNPSLGTAIQAIIITLTLEESRWLCGNTLASGANGCGSIPGGTLELVGQ